MSDKIAKFISGKLRIFSLLFILTTFIIKVNGEPGSPRQSNHFCESYEPAIIKGIQDRIKNLLHKDTGETINLPKSVEWKVKHCNVMLGEKTYSVKVPVTQEGKTKEFKYLAYVQRNAIVDVRSMTDINREKKKLKIMQNSKLTNAADLSGPMLKVIEDRILQKLAKASKTGATPKHIAKTKLEAYDEMINQIEYYVNYKNSNEKMTGDNQFIVYVRYRNGEQEIIGIKSRLEIFRENLEHPSFS